jgi:cytochrome c oxidase subunit 4
MRAYIGNRLTVVWAVLTAVTIASWLIGRGHGVAYHINAVVTVSVLVIAAIKALLVFQYFMEARIGPAWLKRVVYSWAIGLPLLLLVTYWQVYSGVNR